MAKKNDAITDRKILNSYFRIPCKSSSDTADF